MKLTYKGVELDVKEKGTELHIGIRGVNEWRDFLKVFKPKGVETEHGNTQENIYLESHDIYFLIREEYNIRKYTKLVINGHSQGAAYACHITEFLYKYWSTEYELNLINPWLILDRKYGLYLESICKAATWIYRNDWLWKLQTLFGQYPHVGLLKHNPWSDWKLWTAWGDHTKSRVWGD